MDIDLQPHEWKREKPRVRRSGKPEPVFGPGAPEALAYAVSWLIVFFVLAWATGMSPHPFSF